MADKRVILFCVCVFLNLCITSVWRNFVWFFKTICQSWHDLKIKSLFTSQQNQNSQQHEEEEDEEKQINAKQIWKLSKTNRSSYKLKDSDTALTARGFIPRGAVVLLRPRCHFEEERELLCCCCKLPFSLLPALWALCTVQHVEGEIKVKATSTGSCSAGGGNACKRLYNTDTQTPARSHADGLIAALRWTKVSQ